MSVWFAAEPASPSLSTGEGDLVSISIHVEPRQLESLLEALARLDFPINPQIYHDAAVVQRNPDGCEETRPITLVEFPAYEARLPQVRSALAAAGFDASIASVSNMWDAIHLEGDSAPAPQDTVHRTRRYIRHRAAAD